MNQQIKQYLDQLMQIRKDLKTSIESKGYTVSNDLVFTAYPNVIEDWGKAQQDWNNYIQGTITKFTAKGITEIGDYAFYQCKNLVSADLTGIAKIGDCSFAECGDSFRKVWIPSTCTEIAVHYDSSYARQAFVNCKHLVIYTDHLSRPSGWSALVKYSHWATTYYFEDSEIRWNSTYEDFLNA